MQVQNDISPANPTTLKPIDTDKGPLLEQVSDADFTRFVPTGITVKLTLPIAKNSCDFLFGINVDGLLLPWWNVVDPQYSLLAANMFPVQASRGSVEHTFIEWEMIPHPIYSMMMSHRYCTGNVRVGLRVTSNVGQTGNMMITELNNATRRLFDVGDKDEYLGLRFNNFSSRTGDSSSQSFMTYDVSLNRNIAVTPNQTQSVRIIDVHKKMLAFTTLPARTAENQPRYNLMETQFSEDWLLFYPLSNLPNTQGNEMFISIFFDYSSVKFYGKGMPILATVPMSTQMQIMLFSVSLNGKTPKSVKKSDYKFLPGVEKIKDHLIQLMRYRLKKNLTKEEEEDEKRLQGIVNLTQRQLEVNRTLK